MSKKLRQIASALFLLFACPMAANAIVVESGADQFPTPRGVYELVGPPLVFLGLKTSAGIFDVEITSMDLRSVGPSISLAPPAPFVINSFFAIFIDLTLVPQVGPQVS